MKKKEAIDEAVARLEAGSHPIRHTIEWLWKQATEETDHLRDRVQELENDNEQIDRYFDEALKYIEGLDVRFVELQEEVRGCHADSRELERRIDQALRLIHRKDCDVTCTNDECATEGCLLVKALKGDG